MLVRCVLMAGCLFVLVGCSPGSDSDDGGTTTAGAAAVTEPEATTTTVVVEREQLEIPTEWDSELDEIYGRFELYRQAYNIAAGPPFIDPDYGPLQELSAGEQAEIDRDFLETSVAEEMFFAEPENSVSRVEIKPPQGARVLSKTEGNEFVFGTCVVDGSVTTGLDGSVLNDRAESFFQDVEMTVVDGEWRVTGRARRGDVREGEEACENFLP